MEATDDIPTRAMQMAYTECGMRIKEEIEKNQKFTNVVKMFGFTEAEDIFAVLTYYRNLLSEALPQKGRDYLQGIFDKGDEKILAKWVEVIYNPKSSKYELQKLLQDSDFYECINDLKANNFDASFLSFYETLRNDFNTFFIESRNLHGILEIYQCLLRCNSLSPPNNSAVFYNAVKKLWSKCYIKNAILNLETDETAMAHPEHERLEKLVEKFEGTLHTAIVELIKNLFQPTHISLVNDGTRVILKIEGFKVIMSNIFNNEKTGGTDITSNKNITDVQVIANNELLLDQNLILPGINFSCISNNVIIPKPIIINLSGKDGVNDASTKNKAKDGKEPGENGTDGKDGKAGQSSGNFAIVSQIIQGKKNLKLLLNGGKGDSGQNGGDGADGKDSVGVEFDKVFNEKYRILKGFKQGINLLTGSLVSRAFDKKKETKKEDGSVEVHCDSPYYFSTHTFEFIKGPDGGKGGLGGKNGKGGQGGYKGTYQIEIDSKIINDEINVEANDGGKGTDGHPGINGDYGKEGWDIALINSTLGERIPYGQTHDKKLFYKYSATKKENSIYMQSEDIQKGSKCFVEIHERDCIKKTLAENEKSTQFKAESERSGESIAVRATAIDMEALKQSDKRNVSLNSEAHRNLNTEEIYNVERVMEYQVDLKEEQYTSKTRHKLAYFREVDVDEAALIPDNFWTTVSNFSLTHLFDKFDETIQVKLKKKHMLYKLRSTNIEAPPRGAEGVIVSDDEMMSADEKALKTIFTDIKNTLINDQPLEIYLTEIEKAFLPLNPQAMQELTNQMMPFALEKKIPISISNAFQNDYDDLPEKIKKTECFPLFCIFKLYGTVKAFTDLQKRRIYQTKKFCKTLDKYEKKYEFSCILTSDGQTPENKIHLLFQHICSPDDTTLYLQKELQFLCDVFPSVGNIFLNSLLLIFDVEGCHIDVLTLKYLIDALFNACCIYENFNSYIFPSILLTTEQINWIDSFCMFQIETALKHRLKNRQEFEKILKETEDENLKILCTEKLYEAKSRITENELMTLLDSIKDSHNLYPHAKNVNLEQWIDKMQQIQSVNTVKCKRMKDLGEESERTVLFWCSKLNEKNLIKNENTEKVQEKLIDLLQHDRSIVARFIYRLCDNGNIVNKTTSSLEDILKAALHCLKFPKNVRENSECYNVVKELLAPYPKEIESIIPREFCDIKELCKSLNDKEVYETILEDVVSILSNNSIEHFKSVFEFCNNYMEEKANCGDALLEKYKTKFDQIYEESVIKPDKDQFLLEIVNTVIQKKRNFKLRHTQKIAILCVLKDYEIRNRGILQQIATGEGKTLIIATISIISALKGRNVNIVTSSPVLAKRDASNSSSGCADIYEAFGLKADHICYECPQKRQEIYSKCHIVYGDLTSYQRDFLLDEFYTAKIASSRGFDIMIVDEVDSLLLDNGLNTLYLSHNIADFEMLHSLIIHIWNSVNIHIKENAVFNTNLLYQQIHACIFPVIKWFDFVEYFSITELEAIHLKDVLLENEIIDVNGTIIIREKKQLTEKLQQIQEKLDEFCHFITSAYLPICQQFENDRKLSSKTLELICKAHKSEAESFLDMLKRNEIIDDSGMLVLLDIDRVQQKLEYIKTKYFNLITSRFMSKYDRIIENVIVNIPEHMQFFVSTHLKEFIENAEIAYFMEVDVSYRIGMSSSFNEIAEPKIVIIDRDTGVDLPTTQWHKGLHQFLQLKHGLRLTALSTKAVFISNISFLLKFEKLYGFTGTLGADGERKQFHEFYKLNLILLPSSNVKQFYEEPTIITKTKAAHYNAIFDTIKEKMQEGRSILIIGDSSKDVVQLNENIKRIAEKLYKDQRLDADELMPFQRAVVYKQDSEDFKYGRGTELDQKAIIFATNLAGRGTDIILSENLKSHGGLHVIIAFLPKNVRVEEQAFGRAARSGERGTAQLIIFEDSTESNSRSRGVLEMKWIRNIMEEKRIRNIRERYESKIKVEEKCFEYFCAKFKDLKDVFNKEEESQFIKILSKDMLDNWALFLDKSEYQCSDNKKRIEAAEEFCFQLTIDKEPLQPINMLNFAIAKIKVNKYSEASKLLKAVGSKYPTYLPEAQYYTVFLTTKGKEEREQLEEAKKELCEAKNGFTKRLLEYKEHIDIVESHKVIQENRCLQCDTFIQQQKESALLIKRVIESIDVFFGRTIEAETFHNDLICKEAAMFLFDRFSNPSLYGNNPPIKGLNVKQNIDEKNLNNYCKSNGLCFSTVTKKLNELQNSTTIALKDLQNIMEIPTWENFWNQLERNKLITDIKSHIFVNTLKLPELSASKIDQFKSQNVTKTGKLFQHLFVTKDEWVEFDVKEVKANINETLLILLFKNKIMRETKSGILKPKFQERCDIEFSQFSTITKDNLMFYDISEEEANAILDSLIENRVIEKINETTYKLLANPKFAFITWYENVVLKMIKQKLAFASAYQILKENVNVDSESFRHIKDLVDIDEKLFISELIDNGILEQTNVNLDGLKRIGSDTSVVRETWESLWETESKHNVTEALKATKEFIQSVFQSSASSEELLFDSTVTSVINVFEINAPINQKYSTFDISLIPIKDKYRNESDNNHLMITHGLSHLIEFHQKIWTRKSLIKSTAITAAGLAQLAGGVVLFTTAGGALPGKVFAFEGLSDIVFGARGFFTGQCGNYRKHKILSIGLNITTCGITETIKFTKDSTILKTMFSKVDVSVNSAFNFTKQAVATLAPALLQMDIVKDKLTLSREATDFAIKGIHARIKKILDDIFNSEAVELEEMINIVLQNFGIQENDIKEGLFKKFIQPILFEICYFMVAELRTSIIENNEINKERSFATRIVNILKSPSFEKLLNSFKQKLESGIKYYNSWVVNNIESDEKDFKTDEMEVKAKELIQSWKEHFEIESIKVLIDEIKIPSNFNNEAEYQRQMDCIVIGAYSQLRRSVKMDFIEQKTKNEDINNIPENSLFTELKTNYYRKIKEIQSKTRQPFIFAAAMNRTSNINILVAEVISKLIENKLSKSVTIKTDNEILIQNGDLEIIINDTITKNASDEDIYDQLVKQLPEFATFFKNHILFENELAKEIQQNLDFFIRHEEICQPLS